MLWQDAMESSGGAEELPLEIIERVLSFLSVPELCRLRSVCKSWRELLGKPSFHDLYEVNGKNDAYLFITRDLDCDGWSVVDPIFRRTVSFLDLEAQRWYSIEAGEALGVFDEGFETQLSAMDDGLVCELSTLRGSDDDLALTISDPVARTRVILPAPPEIFCLGTYLPIILPAVDNAARSYKVFLVNNPRQYNRGVTLTRVHVHESSSNEWRGLRNPPKEFEESIAGSAVIFQEILYIVFRDIVRRQFVLLSYKLQEDVWTEIKRMSFPVLYKLRHPQLVVRGDRLFMNAFSDGKSCSASEPNPSLFEVIEIVVADSSSRTVIQFSIAQIHRMFGEQDSEFDIAYGLPCFDSSGLCNSIVLMSSLSGKLILYDLTCGSVSVFPANPLIQVSWEETYPAYDIFRGKNMNLSLRNLLAQRAVPGGCSHNWY